MGLIKSITHYVIRKTIHIDFKNTIYKVTENEYFFKNEGVSSTIRLHTEKGLHYFLFNVKTIDKGEPLVNFATSYNPTEAMDEFIINHCKNNPIFMIHEMDIPSITSRTFNSAPKRKDYVSVMAEPIFMDETKLNQSAFELSFDTNVKQHLHHCLHLARSVKSSNFKFKFININRLLVGPTQYQVIELNKKKITKLVSKYTLGLTGYNNAFTDVFTVYDINGVVCVKKNVFDMVDLGRNMNWMLYLDGVQIEAIISSMFKYLHAYVDLFETTLLFYQNSPCRVSQDKNNIKLDYIDGHRSCLVNVNIAKRGYHNTYDTFTPITKNDMSKFFESILKDVKSDVFKLCANKPSGSLLEHLSALGFNDCKIPINSSIIEVLKMHDY